MTSEQAPEQVPTAEIRTIEATGFSVDGSMFMIAFRDAREQRFVIRMEVERMADLQNLIAQKRQQVARQDMPLSKVSMRFPREFQVGHSDQMRGCMVLTFDQKTPDEANYVMPDEAALNLAEGIEQNVLSRMTPQQRHDRARRRHPLLLPQQQKLIVPGGLT